MTMMTAAILVCAGRAFRDQVGIGKKKPPSILPTYLGKVKTLVSIVSFPVSTLRFKASLIDIPIHGHARKWGGGGARYVCTLVGGISVRRA